MLFQPSRHAIPKRGVPDKGRIQRIQQILIDHFRFRDALIHYQIVNLYRNFKFEPHLAFIALQAVAKLRR